MELFNVKTKNRLSPVDKDRREKREVLQILNSGKTNINKRMTGTWTK